MPSQIDFAIAAGLFITFIVILFIYLTGYLSSYTGLVSTSELRTAAQNIFNMLFGWKGVPKNWNEYTNYTPVVVGLMTDIYRIPVIVKEINGTDRGNVTVNATISFDFNCENNAWNSTVRVIEGENEIPSQLYNQSLCVSNYLNRSDVVFNSSFSANQKKVFFVYFSGEKTIAAANYSLIFSAPSNFSVQIVPEEKLSAISASKVMALRNLTYDEVVRTLGTDYKFYIEISEK